MNEFPLTGLLLILFLLMLEYLETIPEPGTSLKLHGHPIEILRASNNTVKTIKVIGGWIWLN